MRKFAIPAAISLVVVVGALLFLLLSSDGGVDSPYGAAPPPVLEDDLGDAMRVVDLTGRTKVVAEKAPAEAVSPAAEGATLSGTVWNEFGDPIAGAQVFLRSGDDEFRGRGRGDFTEIIRDRILGRGVSSGDSALIETVTDVQGQYAIALAAIPRGTYRVYARHDEYAASYESWEWTPESSVVDFRLARGSFITGIVLDQRDLPIAGAVVEAQPEGDRGGGFGGRGRGRGGPRSLADKTTTNSDGIFRLSLSSGTYRISADSDKHTSDSVGDVATGTSDVVIVLRPSKELSGVVVDEAGQALPGATVALYSFGSRFGRGGFGRGGDRGRGRGGDGGRGPGGDGGDRGGRSNMMRLFSSPRAEVLTDGNGLFRFTDVPAEGYAVIASKPGYVTNQATGSLEDREAEADGGGEVQANGERVTVKLEKGAVLSGVVTDPNGLGVGGAFVAVATDRGEDERFGRGGRGGFGRGGPGGFDRGGRGGFDRGGFDRGGFDRGGRRDGGDGEEAAPEEETGPAPPEPVSMFSLADGAETDASGRFAFDTLPAGKYSVSVESNQHPVFREDAIELEKDDQRSMEIVLEKGISLRGKVASVKDGEPIQKARLSFRISDRQRRSVETNDEGEYEIEGLLPATISEVDITAAGYTDGFFENIEILSEPQNQERNFDLQAGASVAGTIRDTSGNPVYNARITLTPAIDVEIESFGGFEGDVDFSDMRSTFRRTFTQSERTRSGVDGQYLFDEVGGGMSFRLEAEHPDYRPLKSDVISVEPGESLVGVDLQLKMGARIEVLVRDSEGMALPGARVSIERQRTVDEYRASMDERRRAFEEERTARAENGGGDEDDERARRRGRDMREMVQRMVSRGEEDAVRRTRNTGPDGKVVFSGMDGGAYLVRVSAPGHQGFYGQAMGVEDESVTVTADLLAENVITGVVQDRFGEPVPGAEVEASRVRENPATASLSLANEDEEVQRRFRDRTRLREDENDRTDEEGRFRIGQLANGTYELRVRARGFTELRMPEVGVNRDQTIVLERLGGVAGVVVVAESGLPITAFRLRLVEERGGGEGQLDAGGAPEDGGPGGFGRGGFEGRGFGRGGRGFDFNRMRGGRWRPYSDPAGAFLIENINPGRYSLEVLADGFAGTSVPVSVEDGLVTDGVQVALAEGLSIAGTVVAKGRSEPIPGARIYLVDMTPAQSSEDDSETRRRRTPSTRRGEEDASDPSDRTGRRTRASRRTDEEEAKLAFATLEAARKTSGGSPLQTTDDTGYFKLLEVTVGRYMLVVDHDEFVPARKEIRIDADRVLPETRVDLDPGSTLKGSITLSDGQSSAGLTVVLQTADGYSRRSETDAAGRYTITGLIPGDYSMSVRGAGGLLVRGERVAIEDGNNTFDYRPEK